MLFPCALRPASPISPCVPHVRPARDSARLQTQADLPRLRELPEDGHISRVELEQAAARLATLDRSHTLQSAPSVQGPREVLGLVHAIDEASRGPAGWTRCIPTGHNFMQLRHMYWVPREDACRNRA